MIGVDGSAPRVLASGISFLARPTWSPDGREIAFSACCERELSWVYAIGSNGEGRHTLAGGSAQVAWSPDGSRIAFIGPVVGNPALVVANRDGGSPRLLTRDAAGGHAVAWSPDSTRIAFDVPAPYRSLDVGVAVVSADGAPVSPIVRPGSRTDWSSDGSRIAFDSWLPYRDGDIQTLDVRTGSVTPFVQGPRIQHSPRWSPDGAHLAYVSEAGEADRPDVGSYLEVVRADGSDRVRITPESPPAMPKVVPAETIAHPDGLYVAEVVVQPAAVRVGGRVRATVTVETQEWGDFVDGAIVFVAHCSRGTVIRAAPAVTRAGRATIAIRVVAVSLARNAVCLRFRARVPGDTDGRIFSFSRDAYVLVRRGR